MASDIQLSPLAKLARLITPPPPFTPADYDGLEYRWKMFVFRPALFKYEAIALAAILLYLAIFFVGKSSNLKIARKWVDAHYTLLTTQFSNPSAAGLVSDGYSDFFTFSTGRKHIASLHIIFSLLPRHDLAKMVYQFGKANVELLTKNDDVVELDFKLFTSHSSTGFVWGVVSKDYLSQVKDGRWDLTLTRTTESPLLGSDFCVMTEYADVTESLVKACSFNFAKVLNDPKYSRYIRSLTITDQPRERPRLPVPPEDRERHVVLSLRVPPSSQTDVTVPLVKSIFTLIDNMETKLPSLLRPETKAKLRKTREEIDDQIKKEEEAERKEEAELEKVAAKKKAADERLAKLSAAEQRKELERDRKRASRRVQGKMVKK